MPKGKTNNPNGRPRKFGERSTISLALRRELIDWTDAMALQAGLSRTQFLTEMIELFAAMSVLQFVQVTAEGTVFRQMPNPEISRSWLKAEYQSLAAGVTIRARTNQVVLGGVVNEKSVEVEKPVVPGT